MRFAEFKDLRGDFANAADYRRTVSTSANWTALHFACRTTWALLKAPLRMTDVCRQEKGCTVAGAAK